jgi:beta-phosphoglucomutase
MKCKAIIFDLDGVICHTDKFHYQAWKALANSLSIPFDEEQNSRLRGVSRMESLNIILEGYAGEPLDEVRKADLASWKNEVYRGLLVNISPADIGDSVQPTLDRLRAMQFMLAIGSSSRNARLIIDRACSTNAKHAWTVRLRHVMV